MANQRILHWYLTGKFASRDIHFMRGTLAPALFVSSLSNIRAFHTLRHNQTQAKHDDSLFSYYGGILFDAALAAGVICLEIHLRK